MIRSLPQVSVVIPTRNRAELLPAAVASVLEQTFQDFEVVIVDDCSSDGTPAVVKRLSDPRIRYLRHSVSRGGGAARNSGITEARSALIAFLDDDDEWYPHKLCRQLDTLKDSGPDIGAVYCGYVIVERATGQVRGRMRPSARGDLSSVLLGRNPIGGTSCMLVRKACLEKAGGFDERLPSFQDRDLWIRLARVTRFNYVEEPLLRYYVHEKKVWTDCDALLRGLELMLAKHGSSAAFRKASSDRYLFLAMRLCEANRIAEARAALRRAIRLDPLALKAYVYLALASLGSTAISAVRARRARMLGKPGLSHS